MKKYYLKLQLVTIVITILYQFPHISMLAALVSKQKMSYLPVSMFYTKDVSSILSVD